MVGSTTISGPSSIFTGNHGKPAYHNNQLYLLNHSCGRFLRWSHYNSEKAHMYDFLVGGEKTIPGIDVGGCLETIKVGK